MKVGFLGNGHLAKTMNEAALRRGFETELSMNWHDFRKCELVFGAYDIEIIDWLDGTRNDYIKALAYLPKNIPFIVMSQVPPGFTRDLSKRFSDRKIYYQLDTLIINRALARAMNPERIITGCTEIGPVDRNYSAFVAKFECPWFKMSYESAEFAKQAINIMLASQIATANVLSAIAGAWQISWKDVEDALRSDRRIGWDAYIAPGEIGGHLPRDIKMINAHYGPSKLFDLIRPFMDMKNESGSQSAA